MMKKLAVFMAVLLLTACGKPLSEAQGQYAGLWKNQQTSLLITESGRVEYRSDRGALSTSISLPVRHLSPHRLEAGFLIFSAEFELGGPPAQENGVEYLLVDGEKLYRTDQTGHLPQASRVPGLDALRPLVEDELARLADGIRRRDFTDYLKHTSKVYQSQFDNDALVAGYKHFSDRNMDLADWMHGDFILTSEPTIDVNGVLTVEGRYKTSPTALRFSIDYIYVPPEWRSLGANIEVKKI